MCQRAVAADPEICPSSMFRRLVSGNLLCMKLAILRSLLNNWIFPHQLPVRQCAAPQWTAPARKKSIGLRIRGCPRRSTSFRGSRH